MSLLTDNVLTINLVASTVVFWAAARTYLMPRLAGLSPRAVLLPILLLHSTRHLGLMFLAPGATNAGMPQGFAYPAAFGDFLAAFLAFVAFWAVVRNSRRSRRLVWVFNLWGSADLLYAYYLGRIGVGVEPGQLGAAYFIPTVVVPLLLITHALAFRLLLRSERKRSSG